MEQSLTNLPKDLIFKQLTYLPFDDVVKVCSVNSTLHSYCSDPKYNTEWKLLIDNTFSSVYNYEDKLNKIRSKLGLDGDTYNYLVYTQLIKTLDPLTQLMIYYRQKDDKSFNDKRFKDDQRFLAMFLLNKPEEMGKYSITNKKDYFLLLEGKTLQINNLNMMLSQMTENGNVKGVKYLVEQGANINARFFDNGRHSDALGRAGKNGHLDVVKYLVEQGANINELSLSNVISQLDVVKYLVEHGVDIHFEDDFALSEASLEGNLDVVKYLVEQGLDINADNKPLEYAISRGHLEVVKYLVEHGANIHASSLGKAIEEGHLEVVKYLVEQGANINAVHNFYIEQAARNGHLDVIEYLRSTKSKKRNIRKIT